MPVRYIMRYYHPFPEAIPLSEAGCSRVTHPSATNLIEQAPLSPFDLHVLSVPPAFVLSQDQTLYKVVYQAVSCFISYPGITIRSQLPFVCFFVFSDVSKSPVPCDTFEFSRVLGFFFTLFNFQDTGFAVLSFSLSL